MPKIFESQEALNLINDPASMKATRLYVWSEAIAGGNSEIGKETGKIEPESLLKLFEKREKFKPEMGASYEAFILYRLSKIFEIQLKENLEMKFDDGAPQIYLNYLERRLSQNFNEDQFATILRTMGIFMKERGLSHIPLLSPPQFA
jgi:hypothetical protein